MDLPIVAVHGLEDGACVSATAGSSTSEVAGPIVCIVDQG